ncbi:MAG: ABC transporter ATP-binding protein [Arenicellales bacterium]|nr:ABC transporter ATP-binding protein [Arenicellales bacterium]HJP45582.1 ABC transporter ATP-binding protein [Arenicellales bacterium]
MLELQAVGKTFGELQALHGIDLHVRRGTVSGLIGPNGSGKTTLVNIITGIYAPDSGRVLLDGKDVSRASADQITRLGVSRSFQNIRIFNRMSVLENVIAALIGHHKPGLATLLGRAKRIGDPRVTAARRALETVGLLEQGDLFANELPLPLRRRLEIARALACDPKFLVLDEPAGGMTPAETASISELIRSRIAPGRTCVVIEHKMDLISHVCEHLCVLNHGEKIAEGDPRSVVNQPEVIEAYLG